jgi:hypothetical protein
MYSVEKHFAAFAQNPSREVRLAEMACEEYAYQSTGVLVINDGL